MKILHIEDFDTDECGDFLSESATKRFLDGKFTHIESEGSICEASPTDAGVLLGEEVCCIADFDGYYVHYDKVIEAVCRAWDGENPGYGNDPLELVQILIDERDDLKKSANQPCSGHGSVVECWYCHRKYGKDHPCSICGRDGR